MTLSEIGTLAAATVLAAACCAARPAASAAVRRTALTELSRVARLNASNCALWRACPRNARTAITRCDSMEDST
jgi:hypothetical protein